MKRPRLFLLTFALSLGLLLAEGPGPEPGTTSLFNGKDLEGWVPVNAAPGTFFVKDEMLITTGVPTGLLRTAKRYENFVLDVEWMHVKEKGNSGIFVWADPLPAVGSPFTRAIEVQVLDGLETKNYTSHGDVFSIWGAKFTPDRPHPSGWERCLPSEKRARPAGQWNRYRITCNDGVIKLAVNGKEVSGGAKARPRMGYICLEAEGSECRFRNLVLKELPSTKPKPEEACPEAKGHRTLFTGIDLSGWKPHDEKAWKVESGPNVLRHTGKEKGRIATEKEYGDYELILDVRASKEARAVTASLRGEKGLKVRLDRASATGKWARYVFEVKGDAVSQVTEGGSLTSRMPMGAPRKGPIVIESDGPVEVCNLFLRELK
jgi:hypothetical protein